METIVISTILVNIWDDRITVELKSGVSIDVNAP